MIDYIDMLTYYGHIYQEAKIKKKDDFERGTTPV